MAIVIWQPARSQTVLFSTFFQLVNVHDHQGEPFKLEGWIFVERLSSNAGVTLMALSMMDGKQLATSTGKLTMEGFKTGEWNKVVILGKIDKHANQLAIGALFSGKAKFFFDDLKLSIKGQEITIKNGEFEDSVISPWQANNLPKEANIKVINQPIHAGKQALCIDMSNIATSSYGNNSEAGKYANINGNKIYYEVYGDGQPLLMLHGALESIVSFEKQIPFFAKSFKVIAVDTRGHGNSTADSMKLSYELYADDVYKLLNELNIDSAYILGWSDGGNTGLILAMQHPGKVKKLAVMGAVLFNNNTSIFDWVNKAIKDQIKTLEKKNDPSQDFEWRVKHCLLTEPNIMPSSLKAIKCPVLVMAGEHDVVKEGHTKLIANSIPSSKMVIFEKASHQAPVEIPDKFNHTVLRFFQE